MPSILDILFPKTCLFCRKGGKYICLKCVVNTSQAREKCPFCLNYSPQGGTHPKCLKPLSINGIYSTFKYEGVIKKAIISLKYKFTQDLAKELSDVFCSKYMQKPLNLDPAKSLIIPVPVSKKREKWRGFNHAELLAKETSVRLGISFQHDLILKLEETTPQAMLAKEKRLRNLRGKFAVNPQKEGLIKKFEKIIIFDDVATTGSTLKEIAKTLKIKGAHKVYGLTIAS